MYKKDKNGFVACPDGVTRHAPSGLSLHHLGGSWVVCSYDENGNCEYRYFKAGGSSLQQAYENALAYLRERSDKIETFTRSNKHRLGKKITDMENMSVLYQDRDRMPPGISYQRTKCGTLHITVSLFGTTIQRYIAPFARDWEATISELRDIRLERLKEIASERRVNIAD